MRSRGRTGAVGALLPLLLLTGCSVAPAPSVASPAPTAAAVVNPGVDVPLGGATDLYNAPNGTVLATGSFTGGTDAEEVSGTVTITLEHNQLTVTLRDLHVGVSIRSDQGVILELNALADDATVDEYRLAHSQLGTGVGAVEAAAARQQEFSIGYNSGDTTTDPSWMRTAVIWQQDAGLPYGQVLATAALTWTLPDLRPDLAVRDTGAVEHATGTVIYDSAGDPSGYLVADGDILDSIADRFGVERPDLDWLNPMRGYAEATTGETLNLSRYERGR